MRKNNKGLSLVELIVVIALMAVLIGIGALSFSLLFGTQAKACAQNVSGILNETKTGCMSRYDETMTLSYRKKLPDTDPAYEKAVTSDGYYSENFVSTIGSSAQEVPVGDSTIRRMGSSRVVIHVYLSDGTDFEMGETESITVSFKRDSGAFDKIIVNGTEKDAYITKMTFSSGLRTFTITMVPETGKHTLQG